MSDVPVGWAEILATPLGPEPCDDTPLAALPALFDLERLASPSNPPSRRT